MFVFLLWWRRLCLLSEVQGVFPSGAEAFEVHFHHVLAFTGEDGADAVFEVLERYLNERGSGAEHNKVACPYVARCILGYGVRINGHMVGQGFEGVCQHAFVRIVRDVDEGGGVGHHVAAFSQVRQIAQGFHRLDGENDVSGAFGDEVGEDGLVRDAHVGLHVASPLAHTVGFCLFHVQVVGQCCRPQGGSDGQDALSAYAC